MLRDVEQPLETSGNPETWTLGNAGPFSWKLEKLET